MTQFVKDAAKLDRPVAVIGKGNVSKVSEITESDDRYTIRNISKAVGILLSVHFSLKRILKVRRMSALWIPQL